MPLISGLFVFFKPACLKSFVLSVAVTAVGRWMEEEFPGLCEAKERPRGSELVQRRLCQGKTKLSGGSWAGE